MSCLFKGSFMKNRIPKISALTSVIATGLLISCGGGGGGGGTGTLNVSMTDAPACGFDEVNVTVNMVRVHQSDNAGENASGWVDIPISPSRKINLLDLTNGVMTNLGQTTLPVGRYTQLRLVLDRNTGGTIANSVVSSSGGGEVELTTPSAATSGIKLNGNIEVTENNTTDITLDFDACKSIVKRGNGAYNLKPVIRIIPIATAGTISGYIDPTVAAANKPVVSAQLNGEIIRSTVPNADGSFSLYPISAGNYDVVVTADAHASDVITTVPVTASTTTALGTQAAPLALSASTAGDVGGTVSVNGPVSLIDASPLVTATQTFASGKKVVIKYQNVDVSTGLYSIPLPVAAPRIAQFGSGTPTADASATGIYGMEVSATGYQPQSSPVTISNGNSVSNKDFTLAP
jgi:hypothetical protein